MSGKQHRFKRAGILAGFIFIITCTGCSVGHLYVNDTGENRLSHCFPLPNCVSSESFLFYNNVAPFKLAVPPEEAWPEIKKVLKELPRTQVIVENDYYIHLTFRTLVFRFVDNVELLLNKKEKTVSIRSGSFIALFDICANWLRTRKIRNSLIERGLISG